MGTCLFAWFVGCSSDDSSTTASTSTGAAGSTTSTTGGGKGGSGGSTTMAAGGSGGSTSSTGGSAGSAGSGGSTGGSTGGGSADASVEGGGGCQTACDCSDGVGCFNGECRSDLSAVYCCGSSVCSMSVFSEALCQRKDKTFSRCGGLAVDAGGKDGSINDICPFFSCASGMMCPPDCKGMCDTADMCHKQ